jgi:phosphoglycerate kinase
MGLKTIKEADLRGKRILMRAGFDVAIDDEGNITDDTRIKEALESIKYILKQKPKSLIILSHLGRPEGQPVEKLNLKNVAERLAKILRFNPDIEDLFKMNPDIEELFQASPKIHEEESEIGIPKYKISRCISLLENVRFYPEEEKNDAEFAKKLASLGELFVFEAFSAAHREQASTTGIMDYLPSYAGLEMAKEVEELTKLLGEVDHPYLLIVGGAKTEDKAPVIDSLKDKVDKILVGGRTSNLLHQQGKYQNDNKVVLNIDGINESKQVIKPDQDPMAALDIGPDTIKLFRSEIVKAHTILAVGPLGKIEEAAYANGTREIFFAVGYSNAYKVAAGGDTIETLKKFGLFENFNFVSGGGGAALQFLAKGTLPAIQKLENQK